MVIDKLRERLLGLMFLAEENEPRDQRPTLDDILAGRVKGRIYDAYRQSWVASPEPAYVAAGNAPMQAPLVESPGDSRCPAGDGGRERKAGADRGQRPDGSGARAAAIPRLARCAGTGLLPES